MFFYLLPDSPICSKPVAGCKELSSKDLIILPSFVIWACNDDIDIEVSDAENNELDAEHSIAFCIAVAYCLRSTDCCAVICTLERSEFIIHILLVVY